MFFTPPFSFMGHTIENTRSSVAAVRVRKDDLSATFTHSPFNWLTGEKPPLLT